MLDKNGNDLEISNKVWIIDTDADMWEISAIAEKISIKNLSNDNVAIIDSNKLLKHAE